MQPFPSLSLSAARTGYPVRISLISLIGLAAISGIAASPRPAFAQSGYSVSNVIDTSATAPSGSFNLFNAPSISGSHVAYSAVFDRFSYTGIFTQSTSGGVQTDLINSGSAAPNGNYGTISEPVISGNTVGYAASYSQNTITSLYTQPVDGSSINTVLTTGSAAPSGTFTSFQSPSLSGSLMAFKGGYNGASTGVFVAGTAGGSVVALAQSGDSAPTGTFSSFSGLSISGTEVVFAGSYDSGNSSGIFSELSSGTGLTPLTQTGSTAPVGTFSSLSMPVVSGAKVAFYGQYNGTSGRGLFVHNVIDGGSLVSLAQNSDSAPAGTFSDFSSASINGSSIAFAASYANFSQSGIFTESLGGTGGVTAIVKTGDSLFGSTVTGVSLSSTGLDSSGNIAFSYTLANGISGIAVAFAPADATPEPVSLAFLGLFSCAALPAGAFRARRKRMAVP